MPRVAKSCGGKEEPVEEDTRSFQTAELERAQQAPPPPGPPPPGSFGDIGPWLALLGIVVVGGLLVWFLVFHHRHHAKHVVPAVVGLQQQVAVARLTRAGYSVKVVITAVRQKQPRGVVTSQEPGGGSQLPTGSTVALGVSNGRVLKAPPPKTTTTRTTTTTTTQATTTVAAPTSQVPDVTGQDMAAGAGQIEAAGFVAETDPVQGSGTAGSIVQQSPPGGTQGKAGETVTLGVAVPASPPTATIPDETGQTAGQARAALLQAKLTVKTVYKNGKAGVVLGQSPTGSAPAYTQVTITVET
jgi:eukaryotic-like serine/threonine-protein kinase